MPPVGFEPTISAGERPQTYTLDSAANGTSFISSSGATTSVFECFGLLNTRVPLIAILDAANPVIYLVLRKILGPTKERDGTWRIKTNDELDELVRQKNIINHINAQRLSWFGHLHRMPDERKVKKVCKWKPMSIRPIERQKNGWEVDLRNDTK